MHYVILGAILFLCLTLEATLFDELTFYGVKPDLLLVLVIIYAFFRGSVRGAKLGFVFGIAEDLLMGRFVGLNAASKMLIGYLIGWGERRFYKDNLLVPIIIVFGGTIVSHFLYLAFFTVVSGKGQMLAFKQFTLPLALYNTVMGLLIYKPFARSLTHGLLRIHRH